MPLFADGLKKIRKNLTSLHAGERPKMENIGKFTPEQLKQINDLRVEDGLEPIADVIVFIGKHLYNSRCVGDGYSIEEVIVQVQSAFSSESVVRCEPNTVLANPVHREDGKGNTIQDEAVFECTQRHPFPELWSVIPKGDGRHPRKKE